jgi:hypothetical protein
MGSKSRRKLAERVTGAAEVLLAAQDYVGLVDVFASIGWLDYASMQRWRQGQVESLEAAMQVDPLRQSEALELLRSWAAQNGLIASKARYVARTPQQQALRFTQSGDPEAERLCRTHWVSPTLSEKKRERLEEKTNRAPDLLVIQPLKHDWTCHRCGDTGSFLVMENAGPSCLRCVGLGDLEFLPAGDALLSRRAKAKSALSAVVVRFSRSRRRYERQGLLVEERAFVDARREIEARRGG